MCVHQHAKTYLHSLIFYRIVLKSFSVANRAILLFCILATLLGCLISSDWQAFGHDPCHYTLSSTSFNDTLIQLENDTAYTKFNKTLDTQDLSSVTIDEHFIVPPSINASLLHANHCIAMSTEEHTCYWNPVSRVTGKLCIECHPACNSEQKSINFVQFSIGLSLILFISQLFLTSVFSVASDYTPKRYQVSIENIMYT